MLIIIKIMLPEVTTRKILTASRVLVYLTIPA
jgi:hypothetical protein